MRTIYVSPEFPLNRQMRKDVRRGKLQVVREGGERSSLGGGIPSGKRRELRTTGSRLVCMAKREAEVGGGGGSQAAFIDELSCKRKRFVQEAEDTIGFEHFVNLFNNCAHFIYEVAQNAEDAGASHLRIGIEDGRVIVAHNGRDFNCADVKSVTKIARTSKGGAEQIGKFGIGFKSVFALTDRPEIHSGGFHFAIEKLVIPSRIKAEGNGQDTLITLPLNKTNASDLIREVTDKMNYLLHAPEDMLLFLKNVLEFRMRWGNCLEDVVLRKDEEFHRSTSGLDSAIVEITGGANGAKRFRVFRRERTEVAYLLARDARDEEKLIPEQNPSVSIYFPTGSLPELHFRLHIPYTPDASRQSVNYGDQNNALLTADAARLVADTLPVLRDEGLLTAAFIQNILPDISVLHQDTPLDSQRPAHLHLAVAREVKKMFASGEQLLPAADAGYVAASDAILGLENLREFLSEEDAQKIWKRGKWINPDLRGNSMLVALGIPQVRLQHFAVSVGDDFFQQQDDDWLLRFYGALAGKFPHGWDTDSAVPEALSRKPFVRLENGECVAPGQQQIYLPSGESDRFPAVKRVFLDDEQAGDFFRNILGLRVPNISDEVSQFIAPRYSPNAIPNVDKNVHIEDMLIGINAIGEFPQMVREQLSGRPFVKARIGLDSPKFCRPEDCYFPSQLTRAWFRDMDIPFVDETFYDESLPAEWRDFLECLGVSKEIRTRVRGQTTDQLGGEGFNLGFDIVGLSYAMENMSSERSHIAWELAMKHCHMLQGDRHAASKPILSEAGERFFSRSWLYDENSDLIKKERHCQISLSDLERAGYAGCDTVRAHILAKIIGLRVGGRNENVNGKPSPIDSGMIDVKMSMEDHIKWQEWQESQRKAKELDESKAQKAAMVNVEKVQIKPAEFVDPLSIRDDKDTDDIMGGRGSKPGESQDDPTREQDRDGKWAERCAQRWLEEDQFPEEKFPGRKVVSGNEDGRSVGYDLKVIRPGYSDLFVEVKGRGDRKPSYVQVTRAQWKKAQKAGENYWIVVIARAEQKNPKPIVLTNPAGKFCADELDAHPIGIKI